MYTLCVMGFLGAFLSASRDVSELLRADYQKFLHSAREVLATMKNSSDGRGALPPGVLPPGVSGLRHQGVVLPPAVAQTLSSPVQPTSLRRSDGAKKDIVIGMAQNIDPKNFAVFCGSLRRYGDNYIFEYFI